MRISFSKSSLVFRAAMLTACAVLAISTSLTAATKSTDKPSTAKKSAKTTKQRPIKKLSYDPAAPTVELFDGIEEGSIDATMIPKDSLSGNVFIQNKTKKALTVKFPKAVAASQVLKQGYGGGGMGGGMGGGGMGGGMGGGGMGGGQSMGGGMGGGGMGGGGMGGGGMGGMGGGGGGGMMGGMGGGFFSIPPEKTVQVPITTVCLNHGRPEPRPKMTYRLIKLEEYSSDPVLQELLVMVGTGKFDNEKESVQAAVWYVTDKMSWEKLAAKEIEHLGTPNEPYFTQAQLTAAHQLLAQAQGRARDREKTKPEPSSPAKNRTPEKKT
ncbi:MAG TPA: hypothetical protein VKU82_10715 [Planctomycetaceae bacterium]|nr:hypothetical protein [Planctomycetaceae bacterium]